MNYPEAEQIKQIIDGSKTIVILQADNPDADSLGSALALEHILGNLGKEPLLYCAVDMPGYLRYLQGWDRVQKELPKQFDASIIVDVNTLVLLEKLNNSGEMGWLKAKPSIVLDHHTTVDSPLDFAHVTVADDQVSSTGELIFHLAKQLAWPVSPEAGLPIMASILGDTQGLTNDLARSSSYLVMAKLIDLGVSRPQLEELRREASKMAEVIYRYKGRLIERTELAGDGQIATVIIPQAEINEYSPLYNPGVLIQMDTLQIQGVKVSIIFKTYDNGRITAKIRCNTGAPIAAKLAEHFGAGGHPYSSGFKVTGKPFEQVKADCLAFAAELLDTLE